MVASLRVRVSMLTSSLGASTLGWAEKDPSNLIRFTPA